MNLVALSDEDVDLALKHAQEHFPAEAGHSGGLMVFANTKGVDVAAEYKHALPLGEIDVRTAFEWQYGRSKPDAGVEFAWLW